LRRQRRWGYTWEMQLERKGTEKCDHFDSWREGPGRGGRMGNRMRGGKREAKGRKGVGNRRRIFHKGEGRRKGECGMRTFLSKINRASVARIHKIKLA